MPKMNDRVLFVDDDLQLLKAYERKLRKVLPVDTAESGQAGLHKIQEEGPYAVVVADMHMPGMNGIELLQKVKECAPDTIRIMLTGHADFETAVSSVNEGNIFRFLIKPCPPDVFVSALADGINQFRLVTAERTLLEKTLNGSVELLTQVLGTVAPEAFGRALKMQELAGRLAREMECQQPWEVELSALLAPIGYVSVPKDVASKAQKGLSLEPDEREVLARVPEMGHEMVSHIPRLEGVAEGILYQNKNYDGSGLPHSSLSAEDIPLASRIIRVIKEMLNRQAEGEGYLAALDAMAQMPQRYDPEVVETARRLWGGDAASGEGDLISIDPRELQVGDTLVNDISTEDGKLLFAQGQRISQPVLMRIRSYARLRGVQGPVKVRRKV